MDRLPHPDRHVEELLHWYEHSQRWIGEQPDAHQTLACPTCGHKEYFYLMEDPQVPAEILRERLNDHECGIGEAIA